MRPQKSLSRIAHLTSIALIPLLAPGCGDGPTEVRTGALEVSTLTIGSAIDPDGYRVVLQGTASEPIGVRESIVVSDLRPKDYSVELEALSGDCSVVGENPVSITVAGSGLASIHFDVVCPPFLDHIAFDSNRDGGSDIYIMSSDGSDPVNITRSPFTDWRPEWSPDGMRIAFASGREGTEEIFVMDVDGSNVVRLTTTGDAYNPAWSPDGTHIAFDVHTGGAGEIYVMRSDGSGTPINLTNHSAADLESDWSPDGTRIAFISGRDPVGFGGGYGLFVMNADGANPVKLLNDPCIAFPDWSPDGTKIAYQASCVGGAHEIIVVDADGSNRINLTNHPDEDYAPVWSPDGTHITFMRYSDSDGNSDVYVMQADGSNQVNLTNTGDAGSPAWSPGP